MTEALERILSCLSGVKQHGDRYQALCPAHEDRQASLSVREDDGRILLHCHAGCSAESIVESLGLTMRDLFQHSALAHKAKASQVAWYDYVDGAGRLLYQVVRLSPKGFRQRRPNGSGGWTWNLKGVQRVLYRLPQIRTAVASGIPVFVVEGEKDVHSLESQGLAATCNAGGAGKWSESFSDELTGANVVILPDNDNAGLAHAQEVATSLYGRAASVRVVELPDVGGKGDISDWLAAGGTVEGLNELIQAASDWTPAMQETPGVAEFPHTDLGNAERLIAQHGSDLRYDVDAGRWLHWTGRNWQHDVTGAVERLARTVVRQMYDLLKDTTDADKARRLFAHIKSSESAPRLAAMVSLARHCPGIPVQSGDLDTDPWLLNCENGTVELRTGQLRSHRREDLITKLASVVYDPKAECPRWNQFLQEVFLSEPELVGFAKRMAGYMLTGDTREESVFILFGKGQCGKSKFVETLRAVMGDYAKDTPVTTFVERRDSSTADLASLVGARIVTASECDERQSFNEPLLKRLSGGDPVTCRYLYRQFFSYVPTFKVMFSTNEVPHIKSQNFAMKRRLKLVPFRQRFYDPGEGQNPVKDDRLLAKLLAEKSGILRWMVEGCVEWQERGLMTPQVMKRELDSLFESHDPLAEFVEENCELGPKAMVEVKELWRAYLLWCQRSDRQPEFRQPQWFSKNLTGRDGIRGGRSVTGSRTLVGIGLLTSLSRNVAVSETSYEDSGPDLFGETADNTSNASRGHNPFRDSAALSH